MLYSRSAGVEPCGRETRAGFDASKPRLRLATREPNHGPPCRRFHDEIRTRNRKPLKQVDIIFLACRKSANNEPHLFLGQGTPPHDSSKARATIPRPGSMRFAPVPRWETLGQC